jgi:hypothetical protein
MIERMQKKLREAKFFLGHLEHESRRTSRNKPEAFEFYRNAFLVPAHTVVGLLLAFERERYPGWYARWLNVRTDQERALLPQPTSGRLWQGRGSAEGVVQARRNAEVHREGAESFVEWEMVPMIEVQARGAMLGNAIWGFHRYALPGVEPNKIGVEVRYVKVGETLVKEFELCRQYVLLVEELLNDFAQAHGNSDLTNTQGI